MNTKRIWTVDEIKAILNKNDDQLLKAVIKLAELNAYNEKDTQIFISIASWGKLMDKLTYRQTIFARKHIMKYAFRLTQIANGVEEALKVSPAMKSYTVRF